MSSMISYLAQHIAEASAGIVNKIGIISLGGGITNTAVYSVVESQNQSWITLSSAVAVVSFAGSIMFILKIIVDVYYARRKDKREQERHDKL
jgi:hypothetical protein